jgi:predicted aspartyl protease
MIQINSKSTKRLIVEGTVNGKTANFLIDTGATVALVDDTKVKEYGLDVGKKFNGTLVGAGGTMCNVRYCNTFAEVGGKTLSQFLIADIESVVKSIKKETGIEILGIISLPQMKIIGMNIDANDALITID